MALSFKRLVYVDGQKAVIYRAREAQSQIRAELRGDGPAGMVGADE